MFGRWVISHASCILIYGVTLGAEPLSPVAARMQQFVEAKTVSGAVTLVAQHGKIMRLEAVGLADIEAQRAMQPDSIFWIASMTKPITATAVMILQDQGKLLVNDPAGKYIPEFKAATVAGGGVPQRPVTLADLLSHTSGVANPPVDSLGANPTLAEITPAIAKQPLQFEPGSHWKYGSGLTVAGRIVEIVSGQPFDAFLEEQIFRPLGMKDTTFYPTRDQRQRLAVIYRFDKESQRLLPATSAPNAEPKMERRAPNPSGGLCSTASDYFRFYQMILRGGELDGRRIVSAAAIQQMTAIHTGELKAGFSPGMGWALGWGVVREPTAPNAMLSAGAYGHGGAFGTIGWIDPPRDAVLVLMIARSDMNPAQESGIRGAFQQIAIEQLK
jgi:CubicO group peptidase (beta-lactamase class C family)